MTKKQLPPAAPKKPTAAVASKPKPKPAAQRDGLAKATREMAKHFI